MKMFLIIMEEIKNGYFFVSLVVVLNDNLLKLEEFWVDVMLLCVRCWINKFVYSFVGVKFFIDKFILGIDECFLRVFLFVFVMYNVFYWMDYFWKDIVFVFLKMIFKL